MEKFQLSQFTREGAKLLRDVTDEFNRLGVDTSRLPKTFPDDSGKIKLVFVGQFSAGKSSLIKMLTGEDVEIGAAITTQTATAYDWNGLEIIDTPGIHTELRPDHDAITYEQINHAALLIFVITNEGFSQRMGDHFRELAINQKRAANMVLVVNKMDRTALGNVPEQQQIIYADLKKVTTPYDPKDLFLSFTDTESYFKALAESDERRKNRRLERSGHETFITNLNRFVAEKGVLQKINLPLNTIADILRSLLNPIVSEKNNAVVAF
ncbi:MAG: GTP-binding protein, partial [Selenomonadaceae bacterium]|nr:GTP-binding protein [Selenomonadaceae bacterium]